MSQPDEAVILIVGLPDVPTAFDGEYLVEYDPERDGVDPEGTPMFAHVVTTPNIAEAKRFASRVDALNEWRRVSKRQPLRPDGRPNRPLTAFTVEVLKAGS